MHRPLSIAGPRDRHSSNVRRFVLLTGGAAALCGCGSRADLSANELAKRADAICARSQKAYPSGGRNLHTVKAYIRWVDRANPVAVQEERELRALHPGRKEAAKVGRLLGNVHAADRLYVEIRNAFAANPDTMPVKLVRRLEVLSRRIGQEARALGWTVCAADPTKRRP